MEIIFSWIFNAALIASFVVIVIGTHEYGHYYAMKRFGVKVETFAIGFGPELIGWTDQEGTRWQIAAIPFGGFVRPENKRFHEDTTPWQSVIIYATGPLVNIVPVMVAAWIMLAMDVQIFGRLPELLANPADLYMGQFEILKLIFIDWFVEDVRGPVGIGDAIVTNVARAGWVGYIHSLMVISMSIGLVNLLPIRPFDGGGIVAGFLRMILPERWQNVSNIILALPGVALVLVLLTVVTWNDIARLI